MAVLAVMQQSESPVDFVKCVGGGKGGVEVEVLSKKFTTAIVEMQFDAIGPQLGVQGSLVLEV